MKQYRSDSPGDSPAQAQEDGHSAQVLFFPSIVEEGFVLKPEPRLVEREEQRVYPWPDGSVPAHFHERCDEDERNCNANAKSDRSAPP